MKKISDIIRRLLPKTRRTRTSIALIVIAALLIELTSATMYWYASKGIREEVQHRAETELRVKNLEIQRVMTSVETAVVNTIWAIEQQLSQPDSLQPVIRRIVKQNSFIVGVGLAFTADYYPQKGHWFEPYVGEREDGSIEASQIGSATHDYLNADWYRTGLAAQRGVWSEPYYDDAGARMMLCTYTYPIRDDQGRIVALIGADVSLDWLSDVINARHIYPSSYNVVISRTGQLMACPVESLLLRRTIQQVTAKNEDTTASFIGKQMLKGNSGQATLTDEKGQKNYIFYAPIEGETGWSMAVVCSDREIYRGLRQVGFNLFLLMLAGLVLMGYLLKRTIRNAKRLETVYGQKKAMEKELHIASAIQMALLPKIFPPYPDRTDVDIHAALTPARQVGGDLYDFYIRDEKLFFCIGDVSGKGVPASLVMAITRTLFRNVSAHESHPHRILSAINNTLSEDNPDSLFVTFFIGVLDLPTGRLRYANAGHEPPLLIAGTEVCSLECDSNLPLGTMPDWKYTQQETTISAGTTLFLYTDGLTEAMNAMGTFFGKKRMVGTIESFAQRTPQGQSTPRALIETIMSAVQAFVAGAEQSDDLTLLSVQYTRQQLAIRINRSLTLPNDVQATPQLAAFVDEVCQELNFDASQTMQMNLAVEEAVVNVMNYAYPKGTEGDVTIDAIANNERLKFVITDSGVPFDPTAQGEADTTLSVEERPIGGLGIHLVRHYMDSINYERTDGHNVLTLRKRIQH